MLVRLLVAFLVATTGCGTGGEKTRKNDIGEHRAMVLRVFRRVRVLGRHTFLRIRQV